MEELLYNPVYNALLTGDAHLGSGTDLVKYFHEEVSPFVGFPTGYTNGFSELFKLLPAGRRILYATPEPVATPDNWELIAWIPGLQFVYQGTAMPSPPAITPEPLNKSHIKEMIELVRLTKPGPFDSRTIEFGYYHGVFVKGKLAAMTGQRLHPGPYSEISAVCTHPDHLGKGFAAALITHQLRLILTKGQQPFLHVRGDNERAIGVYERLGLKVSREMHFYFMKRRDGNAGTVSFSSFR